MVNASTPKGYVQVQPAQKQFETKRLVTESGYITSSTDYIQLESKHNIRLGGENNTTNLHFFGVNNSSTTNQDVEVYVLGGVVGTPQQEDYENLFQIK